MPNRRVWIHHTAVLGLLFLSSLAMQGCLAVVWLGAVGIDVTRTSDVEFQPFENSWWVASARAATPGFGKEYCGNTVRRRSHDG